MAWIGGAVVAQSRTALSCADQQRLRGSACKPVGLAHAVLRPITIPRARRARSRGSRLPVLEARKESDGGGVCSARTLRTHAERMHETPPARHRRRPPLTFFSHSCCCHPSNFQEGAATATEDAAPAAADDEANGAADAPAPPPLERARAALASDPADRAALEAALADLEAEAAALRDAAAAAEAGAARAGQLEQSLATSKDQYLRLQADFENFRRRTVRHGTWRRWRCAFARAHCPASLMPPCC